MGGLCSALARRASALRAAEGDVNGTPWLTHLLKSKSQLDRNPSEEAWHENVSVDPRDASGKSQKLNGLTVHRLDLALDAQELAELPRAGIRIPDPRPAEIHSRLRRPQPTADALPRLEDDDAVAELLQARRDRQARQARPDHDDVRHALLLIVGQKIQSPP